MSRSWWQAGRLLIKLSTFPCSFITHFGYMRWFTSFRISKLRNSLSEDHRDELGVRCGTRLLKLMLWLRNWGGFRRSFSRNKASGSSSDHLAELTFDNDYVRKNFSLLKVSGAQSLHFGQPSDIASFSIVHRRVQYKLPIKVARTLLGCLAFWVG